MKTTLLALTTAAALLTGGAGVALAGPADPSQVDVDADVALCLDLRAQADAAAAALPDGVDLTAAAAADLRARIAAAIDVGIAAELSEQLAQLNAALKLDSDADRACAAIPGEEPTDPVDVEPTTPPTTPPTTAPPLGGNVDDPTTTAPAPTTDVPSTGGQVDRIPVGGVDTGDGSTPRDTAA